MSNNSDNRDLEYSIKQRVSPLLEETMENSWGVTIPKVEADITDRLKNPPLMIYISSHLDFQEAKRLFKKEFLKKELGFHVGNITEAARSLGIDRRSVHRVVRELEIDVRKAKTELETRQEILEAHVDSIIRSTLEHYKEIIHPAKMEHFYQKVPILSRNIARILPDMPLRWKEAEQIFEQQFCAKVLTENNWNVKKTAEKVGLRPETLHRKIRKLGLAKDK